MASGRTLNATTARSLYEAGRLREAADLCRKILKISPEDAPASHLLGRIALRAGKFEHAAQLIGKAVETDPEISIYKVDLGAVLLEMGRIDAAEKLLAALVEREPNNARALVILGHALSRQGNPIAACEKWQLHMSLKCRNWMDSEYEPPYHPFNTDKFDFPDYDGERLTYVICSTPRCGSTLLGDLLAQSGDLGVPHEYMNFTNDGVLLAERFGIDRADPHFFRSYFDAVKRVRTSPNGVFGIKTHFNQFEPLIEPPLLKAIFLDPKFIQILQRNRIAQAVSASIAWKSEKWHSTQEARKEPDYDKKHIDKCLTEILDEESKWMKFFQIHGIDQHILYYEDLVADSPAVCRRVAAFLGVDTDFGFDIAGAVFKKLGNQINADWEDRYRAENRILQDLPASLSLPI